MIKINHQPSRRDLFWFGLLLPVFVAVLGAVLRWLWDLPTAGLATWCIGTVVSAVFALVPPARRPIYLAWMYAALPIGWTVSHLLLGAVFYLVLTPIGLLMRLVGYDPMRRRLDRQAKTYWIAKDTPVDASRYFRQF